MDGWQIILIVYAAIGQGCCESLEGTGTNTFTAGCCKSHRCTPWDAGFSA